MMQGMKYLETEKEKFPFVYTLNVMQSIQEEYGSMKNWSNLVEKKDGSEPDIKALIFFFKEAINEGIEVENEDLEEKRAFVDSKKVGRLVTAIGISEAGKKLKDTVIESSKTGDESQRTSGEVEKN